MDIELRLKELLIEQGVNPRGRGLIKELAEYLNLHRHTARRLLLGNMPDDDTKGVNRISLRTLGELCDWLHRKHGVPMDRLPAALFGFSASTELWEAVSSMRSTTLFLGECLVEAQGPDRLWVSSRDGMVANAIVEQLSGFKSDSSEGGSEIHTEYVPFRFAPDNLDPNTRRKYAEEQSRTAKKMFERTQALRSNSSHIYIGSQEVNALMECWVGARFNCKPFQPATKEPKTPFHIWFRHPGSVVQSTFGGAAPPVDYSGKFRGPGIYYRQKNRWLVCSFIENKKDAGLVITFRDPGANILDVAIFGLSGRATAALADRVVPDTKRFYPPTLSWQGTQLGVYVCKFGVVADKVETGRSYHIKEFDVIPIEANTLKQYLQPRRSRKAIPDKRV